MSGSESQRGSHPGGTMVGVHVNSFHCRVFVHGGNACGVMTIEACLPPGVGADSRTKRFGNYTIGSRSQSDCIVCDGGVIAGNSKAPSNRGLTQIESESISSEAVGLALTLLWVDRCIGRSWLRLPGLGRQDRESTYMLVPCSSQKILVYRVRDTPFTARFHYTLRLYARVPSVLTATFSKVTIIKDPSTWKLSAIRALIPPGCGFKRFVPFATAVFPPVGFSHCLCSRG
jgi:hypothetical protein